MRRRNVAIYRFLESLDRPAKTREIANMFKLSFSECRNRLRSMQSSGLVKEKSGTWRVL